MSFSCAKEKLYDWAKQTFPGRWLFYGGQRYEHFGPITLEGTVADCVHNATDGDECFDLWEDPTKPTLGMRWHCEVTVCYPDARAVAATLKMGDKVRVSGTRTFDPPHHILWKKFSGGGNEVHPCTAIEVLK